MLLLGKNEAWDKNNIVYNNFNQIPPTQASDNQNYSKKGVMEAVLPVAVRLLHAGNAELARNMARYLSLAAIHHARLLKPHVQQIVDSIVSGDLAVTKIYFIC